MVLQQLDYLAFLDIYHDRIRAFHVKDAEFRPAGARRLWRLPGVDRPAGAVPLAGRRADRLQPVFSKMAQYDYPGWAVVEWECCIKHPEAGAAEGAPFMRKHIIRVTEQAFDDFAGGARTRRGTGRFWGSCRYSHLRWGSRLRLLDRALLASHPSSKERSIEGARKDIYAIPPIEQRTLDGWGAQKLAIPRISSKERSMDGAHRYLCSPHPSSKERSMDEAHRNLCNPTLIEQRTLDGWGAQISMQSHPSSKERSMDGAHRDCLFNSA